MCWEPKSDQLLGFGFLPLDGARILKARSDIHEISNETSVCSVLGLLLWAEVKEA